MGLAGALSRVIVSLMPRCDALVLRLHPDDPDLLEVMLREGDSERRVARAPSSNPRAWEWTTPPSWLRAGAVEALLDEYLAAIPYHRETWRRYAASGGWCWTPYEVPVSAAGRSPLPQRVGSGSASLP